MIQTKQVAMLFLMVVTGIGIATGMQSAVAQTTPHSQIQGCTGNPHGDGGGNPHQPGVIGNPHVSPAKRGC